MKTPPFFLALCVLVWALACGGEEKSKEGGKEGENSPVPGLAPGEGQIPPPGERPPGEVPLLELGGNVEITPSSAYIDAELTATYDGEEAIHFQWKKEGENIEGATGNTYSPSSAGSYAVTVGAPGHVSKTSPSVAVTVNPSLGATWTAYNNAFTRQGVNAICYGNGRFVAGTSEGTLASSTDGITWTQSASKPFGTDTSGNSAVYAVAYGNGRFVAAGKPQGNVAYSEDDGETWVAVADSVFGAGIYSLAWGGGRFVAGGYGGKMATSTDGKTWTAVKDSTFGSGAESGIYGIAYGNGRFVTVGRSKMATSTDGETWTAIQGVGNIQMVNIAWGGGRFVALGVLGSGGRTAHSTDGITWTFADSDTAFFGIAYGGGKFVAGGGGKMVYSTDGEKWTAVSNSTFVGTGGAISKIAYGGGKFIATGKAGASSNSYGQIAYSP